MTTINELTRSIPGCIGVSDLGGRYELLFGDGKVRDATQAEIDAAIAAAARAAILPVTRRQMLTALHRAGLLAAIKGAVAASGDIELQIAFDESQEFQRNNPFLATMAAALGKTDAEVDAIFALAATL